MRHRHPPAARFAAGRTFVGLLLLIAIAGGVYTLAIKPNATAPGAAAQGGERKQTGPVILYSSPDCEPCDRARAWLGQNHIVFEERDIDSWPPYKREVEALGGRVLPVLIVNGEVQHGFKFARVDDALRGRFVAPEAGGQRVAPTGGP